MLYITQINETQKYTIIQVYVRVVHSLHHPADGADVSVTWGNYVGFCSVAVHKTVRRISQSPSRKSPYQYGKKMIVQDFNLPSILGKNFSNAHGCKTQSEN